MKVVIIMPTLVTGGAERVAVSLANWLANNNVETYLINLSFNDGNYDIDSKVVLYNKKTDNKFLKRIVSFIDVIKYLNEIKPDVIFEMLFTPIKYALIYKIFNRRVSIIGSERNNPSVRKNISKKFLTYFCPKVCDGYIFQTNAVKEMFNSKIQKKSKVIGNAVSNPTCYSLKAPKKKEKIITSAGRLTYQKGFDVLIKAFNIVHEKHPDYKLVIYGEGEDRKKLEDLVDLLNLNDCVSLPGKCKDYLEQVAKSEIFVMTSRFEGMPNTLLEAMAIGMPCISTDCVAGPSELINNNENGILVEVDNVEEIANKINYLIENKDIAKKMGENAKYVINEFSTDKIFNEYYKYFKKVYNNKKGFIEKIFNKLKHYKITNIIPDKMYLKISYRLRMHKKLNLKDPQTFNEKLQWLKLYDRKPKYTKMVDKYEAKEYVADKIGEQYIIPTLGVWDNFDDIDFDKLPDQFVLICTHDSGGIVICKDKSTFNKEDAKKKINKSLKRNYFYSGREWPYKNVKPRIIAEQYMCDSKVDDLRDYKFLCFGGTVKCYKVDFDRFIDHYANYYDRDKNLLKFGGKKYPPDFNKEIEMPQNIDKMIELAEKLSKDVPFLRADFYDADEKVYFGELTFYPAAGFGKFEPDEWDSIMGKWIKLPDKNGGGTILVLNDVICILRDRNRNNELVDYKFFCFNGEPKFIYLSQGMQNHKTARISFADLNYKELDFCRTDYEQLEVLPNRPKNFEDMIDLARILSKDTKFLRVDLYDINDKIYFSELTFYPCSGYVPFEPKDTDLKLGDLLKL